jgi:hypothetical protein
MTNITITFNSNAIPDGLQIQDVLWYVDGASGSEIQIGPVVSITPDPSSNLTYIIASAPAGVVPPSSGDFIFYVKNPIVEVSSLKGYFAETQFINESTEYAELFAVAGEVFESSK